jgi:hypothetical protein
MIAFEILVNGQKRFTAGGDDYDSFTAVLTLLRLPLPQPHNMTIRLDTNATTPDPVRIALWPALEDLAVGDRVEIRIVDVATVDAPESMQTPGDETDA